MESFHPYEEPGIVTILVQSSLLLALNFFNAIFDKLIFCGLLGQVFIGVAWGTPGAQWLGRGVEAVIIQLGYLGLILLVYEGGLDTDFRSLKANLLLSTAVAITGIIVPVGLSFVLQSLVDATPLQAFAAGAALCSTSLGTTFTILSTTGLSTTRLGTVLSSAAMMDDVVGLVMVQVISNLGEAPDSFSAVIVVRPLAVSVGLAVVVLLACQLVARPLTVLFNTARKSSPDGIVNRVCQTIHTAFIIHTLLLIGLVTGATYAGTSNLFAAYLAGASISWWDSEVPHLDAKEGSSPKPSSPLGKHGVGDTGLTGPTTRRDSVDPGLEDEGAEGQEVRNAHDEPIQNTGTAIYHKYYAVAVQRILKPLFFASIGFAIPITDMFHKEIVWRGIIYTILMLIAKLATGLWLVRLNLSIPKAVRVIITAPASYLRSTHEKKSKPATTNSTTITHELQPQERADVSSRNIREAPAPPLEIHKPLSLYPAALLGTAMTARGEIGFLIASLAETTGLFSSSSSSSSSSSTRTASSEIYLVVTWAIVLCTIIGPLGVGTLVKRIRRLQGGRVVGLGGPLGVWGVG